MTTASAAVVPVTVATLEGEDLGKKGNKKMRPHKKKGEKGEKAGQTEVNKHPYRNI
jgi:hypothetical protein